MEECVVCGGEFSAERVVIGDRSYHQRCALASHGSHRHEDMANAINLIWKLRTALQKIVAKNADPVAAKALHDLFPTDHERDCHFIAQYAKDS